MRSKYIEEPDVKRLKECLTPGAWLPLWLALETGLRIGDVVALKVSNVKADGIHFTAQKTGKSGVAKISDRLRRALPKKGKWLFPSPSKRGAHLTRQAAWARVKAAGKRAGLDLEGLSPHTLRKVFAVEIYRKEGFKAVQNALQHNNSATTEIYSFSDWNTGENADLPLKRRDLQLIVRMCLEALGAENVNKSFQKESEKRTT